MYMIFVAYKTEYHGISFAIQFQLAVLKLLYKMMNIYVKKDAEESIKRIIRKISRKYGHY
jgi:hypothetical protein